MGLKSDLTLLLGLEVRENIFGAFERANGALEKVQRKFQELGGIANDAGARMSGALSDPELTGGLLQARIDELQHAEDNLQAAMLRVRDANQLITDGVTGGALAQRAALEDVTIALDKQAAAQRRVEDATKLNMAAQEKSAGVGAASFGEKAGKGLDKIGPKAGIVTAAMIGIGYASIKSAAEYNESVVKIANGANISSAAAQKIGDQFLSMSTQSSFSATEMADSYGKVAGQLSTLQGHALSTKQATDFMRVAIDGAAASGQPLSSVTSGLAKMMQQYGMTVGQAAAAESDLYNAARLTGQNLPQLTNQISRMKSQLGVMAPSIGETSSLLLDMSEHGLAGRQATMVLSTSMNTLLKTGKVGTPTITELNNAISKMPASVQGVSRELANGRITLAQYTADMKKLQQGGSIQGGIVSGYMKQFESLAQQAKTSNGTINALKLTPAQIELSDLGISVFNAHDKFIGMGAIIEQLGPKLSKMKDQQQQLAIVNQLFGASVGRKLLPMILAGKDGYEKATKAIEDQTAMQKAAERAENTMQANMKKLHNTVKALGIAIGNALLPFVEKFMSALVKGIKPIAQFIESHKKLAGILLAVVGSIAGVITVLWGLHKVIGVAKSAWDAFKIVTGPLKSFGTLIAGQITTLGEWATATFTAAAAEDGLAAGVWAVTWPILAVIAAIALVVVAVYELYKHWNTVWNFMKPIVKSVAKFFIGLWNGVVAVFKTIWHAIVAVVKIAIDVLKVVLLILLAPIALIIAGVMLLWKHWQEIWSAIGPIVKKAVDDVLGFAKKIIDFFLNLGSEILGAIESLGSDLLNAGEKLVEFIANGIMGAAGKVGSAVLHVIKKIPIIGGLVSGASNVLGHVASFLGFHTGGVVPGNPGKEVPAVLQAGETVLTAQQAQAMGVKLNAASAMSRSLVGGTGSGQTVVVNVTVSGAVYGSLNDLATALGKQLNTRILPQAGVVLH